MQMLFIDESGTVPPPSAYTKLFVLGGVIIPDSQWRAIEQELNKIKDRYSVKGELKWRFFGPSNKSKGNSVMHLPPQGKDRLRQEIYSLITKRKAVKIISVVTDVTAAYALPFINDADQLYQYAYKPITERFQYYLQDLERESGHPTNGMIVCDHRNTQNDRRLQQMHQHLLTGAQAYTSTYGNLIEGLFIAPSHWSIGIQLADLVAGAVYRHFSANDSHYFNMLKPAFRAAPDGAIDGRGLVIQPRGGGTR